MAKTRYLSYQGARSAIEAGRLARLYVMWGDPYLVGRLVDMLKSRLISPGAEDFDYARLDGATTPPLDVMAAVRAAPFVSQRRVVVLDRVKCLKGRGRAQSTAEDDGVEEAPVASGDADWEHALADPPQSSCLVAITEGPPDARLRLTKAIEPRSQFVECQASGRDGQALAADVVRETVGELKLRMDWRAQNLLVSTVGTDCGQLVRELEKIKLWAGGRQVGERDVLLLSPRTAQADIWQLLDAVEAGDAGEAHRIVRASLARGESPVALIASMASQIRIMARAKERTDAGVPLRALPGVLGANKFWVEQSLRRARLFSQAALYKSLRELARIDLGIKTGALDAEAAVEAFVLALLVARGGAGQSKRAGGHSGS